MPAAFSASGNVVEIEDALQIERHMRATFYKGEVPTRVGDLRKLEDSTLRDHLASRKRQPVSSSYWRPQSHCKASPSTLPQRHTHLVWRAGLPTTSEKAGTSRVTTDAAPTMAQRPTVRPGSTTAPAPILQPSQSC